MEVKHMEKGKGFDNIKESWYNVQILKKEGLHE